MAKAKTTSKVTTNTKVEKETKTMAKQASITLNLTGTVEALQALAKYLKENDIKAEKQGKATEVGKETKASTKASSKPASKPKREFDRERYESIAEQLNVLGKHGVHKFARNLVYEAMEEPELTEEKLESYEQKIIAIATEMNLTWFLEKVSSENEAEVEVDLDDEEFEVEAI